MFVNRERLLYLNVELFYLRAGDSRREHAGVQHPHALLLGGGDSVARDPVFPDRRRSNHARVLADALPSAVDGARGAHAPRDAARELR